jgi:hypothetical protein
MSKQEKLARLIERAETAEKKFIRAFNAWQKAKQAATRLSKSIEKTSLNHAIGGKLDPRDMADNEEQFASLNAMQSALRKHL